MDLVHQIRSKSIFRSCSVKRDFRVVDSSTISLCLNQYKWATFRKSKAGIKVHLRLVFVEENTVIPEKVVITPAKPNDRTQMEVLIDEKGAMYVFDRGYVDYEKWDSYCDQGIFFASRLKKNAVIRKLESFSLPEGSAIQSDSMLLVGTPQKRMDNVLRLIETTDSEGNPIQIITNRFDLDAEEIGEIYRSRWKIETFFKWIKQHIRIKTFYGTSQEAVENQVYLALIAYCLLVLVSLETQTKHSLIQLARWLIIFLWRPSERWVEQILRKPNRTSRGRQKKELA